ncbi:hypothetical protein I4U23_027526 [Adineta vaga]|nr:hypothetical protein I4U23_027526 [Adineta vaga]
MPPCPRILRWGSIPKLMSAALITFQFLETMSFTRNKICVCDTISNDQKESLSIKSKTSYLLQLNSFQSGIEDESMIKNERRSTRIYIILLILSIFIIVLYHIIIPYSDTVVLKSPSYSDYSRLSKKFLLQCPCTTISVKYEEFLAMKPHFHELCQSELISNRFIKKLFDLYEESWNNSIETDVRRIGTFQFQTLNHFCKLTNELIEDNLQTFLQTEFIQRYLISSEQLLSQMASSITNFADIIPKTFFRILTFFQNVTAENFFMTGASITSTMPFNADNYNSISEILPNLGIKYVFADKSSCTCSTSTANTCMGLATLNNENVLGLKTGCYMLSALLNSTLEVFYNQTFINILTNSTNVFPKLKSSSSHETVGTMLKQMFIIHWENRTDFEKYFNACAPNICQYTIKKSYEFLLIVTILIGLFGGISSTLRIIIPLIVTKVWPFLQKMIIECRNPRRSVSQTEITRMKKSVNDRRKEFFQLLKQNLIELNFFKSAPPSTDQNIVLQQRITTRLYLILFFLSLIILIIFRSIKPQTIHSTKHLPTLNDFFLLDKQYSQTLHCPCSQITIPYKYLMKIQPEYLEICTSHFVSSDWINIEYKYTDEDIYIDDFRHQSKYFFQLLSTLCQISKQTIEESLQSFYQTQFLSNELLNNQSFQTQFNSIFDEFKQTIQESFQRVLQTIKFNFEINQFSTELNSRFGYSSMAHTIGQLYILPLSRKILSTSDSNIPNNIGLHAESCSVKDLHQSCYEKVVLRLNETKSITIPGLFLHWSPYQSILMSSFECFYNQTCFSSIVSEIHSTKHFSILKSSKYENETIESLSNQLFLQTWSNEILYKSYFNQCQPFKCQYSYETRLHFLYIFTTFLGLVGGLNIVFHLLSFLIVKSISKLHHYICQYQRNQEEQSIFVSHLQNFFVFLKETLIHLNLFNTIPLSNDEKILRRNRRKTRIYFLLLITIFPIVIFYIILKKETTTIIVKNPTIIQYKEFSSKYSTTLQCPCTHISIKHQTIITQFPPEYHEICSSTYLSFKWLKALHFAEINVRINKDLHSYITNTFNGISELCKLSKSMLNVALSNFEKTNFITSDVLFPDDFHSRIQRILGEFKRRISYEFSETFRIIQRINIANQLATIDQISWHFISKYNVSSETIRKFVFMNILTIPKRYDSVNCSCGLQSTCLHLDHFHFVEFFPEISSLPPGFYKACQLTDTIFHFNLNCFYDSKCVNFLSSYFLPSHSKPLEVFTSNSFSLPNITIEQLVKKLFVIKWIEQISFEKYFHECQPSICQYTHTIRYNNLYILTLLLALFGGLSKGMHFFVEYLSIIIYKIIDYRKKKVNIVPNSIQSDIIEVTPESSIAIDQVDNSFESNENSNKDERIRKEICRHRIFLISVTLNGTDEIIIFFGKTTDDLFEIPRYNITYGYPHTNVSSIEIFDWNHDGFNDLIISYYSNTKSQKKFNLLLNIGDGYHFVEFGTVVTEHLYKTTEVVGFTVLSINQGYENEKIILWTPTHDFMTLLYLKIDNDWKAKYDGRAPDEMPQIPSKVIQGKFSYDEQNDLAVISSNESLLSVIWMIEKIGHSLHFTFLTRWYPTSLVLLDFNDDEIDDIAVLHCDRSIIVFLSTEHGLHDRNYLSFQLNVDSKNTICAKSLKSVDLNQDDENDLIFLDAEFDTVRVLLNSVCDN